MFERDDQQAGSPPPTIEQARAGFAALMARFPVPGGVTRTPTSLGGRPAVLVEPEGDARPGTILYFHGGSFALGSPETAMGTTASLVLRTGMRAISVDYRLAPEHPFPAGVDDCFAAYCDLLSRGVEASGVALAGDSAGGAMAVTTALQAVGTGIPEPGCVVCFSPGLDATRTVESLREHGRRDPFFTPEALASSALRYLGGADPHTALASPARYADMTGFPPLLLQAGTDELLLDDSVRLAERAREAGVDVVLDITADVPHVFQAFVGTLDEAGQALDRAALFITQHLGTTQDPGQR